MSDDLIQRFYAAFAAKDGVAMAACYAPDAHFSDPVFTDLRGPEPGAMWKMLSERAADLRVELAEHDADAETGSARWIAHYTFTRTGRSVVNDVRANDTHLRARLQAWMDLVTDGWLSFVASGA